MNDRQPRRLARCVTVWLVMSAAELLLVLWLCPDLSELPDLPDLMALSTTSFEGLLVGLCGTALVGCGAWWWFVTSVVILEILRGSTRPTSRGIPRVARRVVLAACGVALISTTQPAFASVDSTDREHHAPESVLEGLPLPQRPVGRLLATEVVRNALPLVVVAPGDSLWAIARTALGPGATDAEVASYWLQVYRLNHGVIGADPNLIHPGQQLRMPSSRGS